MSIILSVYSTKAFKEYLLPSVNNTEYTLVLDRDLFCLSNDVELNMEVLDGKWTFLYNAEYEVENTVTKEKYFGTCLKNRDLLTVILPNSRLLSIMVEQKDASFTVFTKYALKNCQEITIGQSEENMVQYDASNLVSRDHAVLKRKGQQFIIEDKSANGVFVNAARVVGSRRLEFGDRVDIFGLRIVFFGELIAINTLQERIAVSNELLEYFIEENVQRNKREDKVQDKIVFHRSPRKLYKLSEEKIEIEGPTQLTKLNKKPIGMIIGPSMTMALPMLLGCGLAIYSTKASGNSGSAFMYTGLITAISSAVIGTIWSIANLQFEKKKSKEEEEQRFAMYGEYLAKCTYKIQENYEQNERSLKAMYVSAEECCKYDEKNLLLWNRNSEHLDFLSHRLGVGDKPSKLEVSVPKEKFTLTYDALAEKARMIAESYRILHNVPICIDLMEHRLVGIVGGEKKTGAVEVMHNLVAQIAASNCYTDVKMAFVYDEGEDKASSWEYLKWFPHVWSEDKKTRFIAKNKTEAGDVLYEITKTLRIQKENRESYSRKSRCVKPQYILFIASPELLEGELISKYIFEEEKESGLTTVFLVDSYGKLPNDCNFIIQNDRDFRGIYDISYNQDEKIGIEFDRITDGQLEKLARTLSRIEVNESEMGGDIPSKLTFFDMYKVKRLEEFHVEERWKKNRTYDSMKALVGEKTGGAPCYLDIHEKYHGPHGLVAGTTGSGKSETLQTYMLSLAINFSPEDVGFFIIDYKGGGMANLFDGLPHLIGQISNLSGNQVKRAMVSIKSENRRRQRIFNEYGVNNINLYTRLYKNNEATLPVPHMFIIIDEFAELKREEPEFMRELISVAQVGRSLGVHLILATQKPSGTVDDNIWSNAKFRLCLRVQDRQDSNDMLHKPDAAYITQAGRCYMQVGNDELYELFQSGFSGATYDENEESGKKDIAKMLSSTGRAALVGNRAKMKQKEILKRNWIAELLDVLKVVKEENSIEVLEDICLSDEFIKKYFVEMKRREIDYPYSEYSVQRVKDFLKAYLSAWIKGGKSEVTVGAILQYVKENTSCKLPEKKEKNQLDAIVNYLREVAHKNAYTHNLQLWLPLLPTNLYLRQLAGFEDCFEEQGWKKELGEWSIEAAIGMYDDPVNQAQGIVKVNLSQNGHHAIIGTVSSGKSTFLQTILYSLVCKYTPEEINIYAIDFSTKMLSAFERMPHVGGIVYENEEEKLAKFFNMLHGILEERKKLFRGGNYSQYVRVNGVVIPAIILVIDNYANFRNKTNNIYEDMILQISKEAVNYGIFLMITAGGFSSLEIPNRIGDNLRTTICLEMSDKFQYAEALRTMHIETLPEENIKGRGLVRIGEEVLEFQTALAFAAEDDFSRMEGIQELAEKMKAIWNRKEARKIPEIPEKPVWEEFTQLDEMQKMLSDGRRLPIGYDFKNAAVYGIDLSRNYCYMITGRARSGKTNLLKVIMQSSHLKESRSVVIDFSGELFHLEEEYGFEVIDDDKKVFSFFSELLPEFKERNQYKKSRIREGLNDEEIYLAMRKFEERYIFIADLADFVSHISRPVDAGDVKPFVENLLDKGSLHNVYWFACYNPEDISKVAGTKLYEYFIRYKTGIHFGGNVAGQRIMNFDYVPYAEQSKSLKAGIGMLPYNEEEETKRVIVPLMKG